MCGEIGVDIYKRQEELAAIRTDRRPDLPRIKCPTIVVCGRDDAATPLFLSEEMAKRHTGRRSGRDRPVRASHHDGKARGDQPDPEHLARQVECKQACRRGRVTPALASEGPHACHAVVWSIREVLRCAQDDSNSPGIESP